MIIHRNNTMEVSYEKQCYNRNQVIFSYACLHISNDSVSYWLEVWNLNSSANSTNLEKKYYLGQFSIIIQLLYDYHHLVLTQSEVNQNDEPNKTWSIGVQYSIYNENDFIILERALHCVNNTFFLGEEHIIIKTNCPSSPK